MEKTLCIVLKASDYKDNHKMVTLFSRDKGKISVLVPGAKSLKNGLASAVQPFSCGVCIYDEKLGKKSLKQFDLKKSYYSLSGNYNAYVLACKLTVFVDRVLSDLDDSADLFVLFVNCIDALSRDVEPDQVKDFFLVRFIDYLGISPEMNSCVACGSEVEEAEYFSFEDGGVVCSECKGHISVVPFEKNMCSIYNQMLSTRPVDFNGTEPYDKKFSVIVSEYLKYMTDLCL